MILDVGDNVVNNPFFQHKCTDHSNQSQAGKTVTNVTVCGYTPYQEVRCNISAYNSAGDSQAANPSSVRTDCAGESEIWRVDNIRWRKWYQPFFIAPSQPTNLQVQKLISANDSDRLRWRYGASWEVWSVVASNLVNHQLDWFPCADKVHQKVAL